MNLRSAYFINGVTLIFLLLFACVVYGTEKITTDGDGTTTTTKTEKRTINVQQGEVSETEENPTTSLIIEIVRVIVVVLGGLIGILGVVIVIKGLGGKSDVDITWSEKVKLNISQVNQGVIVTVIGAVILIASVYLLPSEKRVTTVKSTGDISSPGERDIDNGKRPPGIVLEAEEGDDPANQP